MSEHDSQGEIEKLLAQANADSVTPDAPVREDSPTEQSADQEEARTALGRWLLGAPVSGYRIESYLCTHSQTGAEGWIISTEREDPEDMHGWERLCSVQAPSLLRPLDVVLSGGRRWEVYQRPPGRLLAEQIESIGRACPALIEAFLGDFCEALEALHGAKLTHLHLSPDCIWIEPREKSWRLIVGGLERVSCFDDSKPLQFDIDPFYAPPEAAGSLKHETGPGLKAWDWWSVGRILQELELGRHIIEYILDHKLDRNLPEDKLPAEELLLEKFNAETRAGAVEAMPPMDKRVDLLLHGLLTASRDGRWILEDARSWLSGGEPRERYRLTRNERLFSYKGKAYTIPEAVEVLGRAENWDDALKQVLDKKSPYTFASFLVEHPDLRTFATRLDDAIALGMSVDLRAYSVPVKNEVILSMALMKIGGGRLIWRGRRMDAACLREMLSDTKSVPNRMSCIQAFCSTAVLMPLETADPEAFRTLSDGARLATRAVTLATQKEWLPIGGLQSVPNIWRLVWESSSVLSAARQQLRDTYAMSDQPAVQELFEAKTHSPEGALLLAWMQPLADRLGFVTHEIWEERQHKELARRGSVLASALFWLHLRHSLLMGLPWFASFPMVIALGLIAGMIIAVAWPGPEYLPGAIAPLLIALTSRICLGLLLPHLIKPQFPKIRWGLFDGSSRCRREYASLIPEKPSARALRKEFDEINATIVRFSREHDLSKRICEPSHFHDLQLLGMIAWLFFLLPLGFAINDLRKTESPMGRLVYAWTPEDERDLEWLPSEPELKIDFPFEKPDRPRAIIVKERIPSTRAQKKVALRRGIYLARDYRPEDIQATILVKMPHVQDHSFMLYDPVERKIVSDDILVLPFTPSRRSWATIDTRVVFIPDY